MKTESRLEIVRVGVMVEERNIGVTAEMYRVYFGMIKRSELDNEW